MNIKKMKLADLKPAPYNPRTISEAALRGLSASIKRFGLVEPIIVNKRSGHVVGGHQRLKVLEAEGVKETQVVVVDLDAKDEKALNVALNNQAIAGDFTADVQAIIDELRVDIPEAVTELCFDDLLERFEHAEWTDPPILDITESSIPDSKAKISFVLDLCDRDFLLAILSKYDNNKNLAMNAWLQTLK